MVPQGGHDIAVQRRAFEANQQAKTSQFSENIAVFVNHLRQLLTEKPRHILHMFEKRRLADGFQHGRANRCRQRIAAIGLAMRARLHGSAKFFAGQKRSQRKTAANALGNGHHIRCYLSPFMGE